MATVSGPNRFRSLKILGLFAIVALGIFFGSLLSVKSGLTSARQDTDPGGLHNDTHLRDGQVLPALMALGSTGQTVPLAPLLEDRHTVLAFVSGTCDPCLDLYDSLIVWELADRDDRRVILLSETPEYFIDTAGITVLGIDSENKHAIGIRMVPTILVTDPGGSVRLISSGFSRKLTRARLIDALED